MTDVNVDPTEQLLARVDQWRDEIGSWDEDGPGDPRVLHLLSADELNAEKLHRLAHEAIAGPLGAHERDAALDTLLATGPCPRCDAAVVDSYLQR